MHSATTATGRSLPPPRKTLPKNRPAPLTARAPRHPAAPNPHVTSQLQCYIPAPAVTRLPRARFAKGHSFTQSAFCEGSLITRHCKSNRQPARLEIAISPTKQTPAPRFNRQHLRTLHPAFFAGPAASRTTARSSRNTSAPRIATALLDTNGRFRWNNNSRNSFKTNDRVTSYSIQTERLLAAKCITAGHSRSNRHSPRLENAICPRKQSLGTRSNRHFSQVSPSRQRRIAATARPPQVATNAVSNRQWQILEIAKNPIKTPFSAVLIATETRWLCPGRAAAARIARYRIPLNRTLSAARSAPRPPVPPQYLPVRNSHPAPAPRPYPATSPVAPHASEHPQLPPETSFAVYTQSSHSTPDTRPAPAMPRRTACFLPPTKAPRNCARPACPSPASTPNAPDPPGAPGSAPASASFPPRGTPQTPAAPRAMSSRRDRRG